MSIMIISNIKTIQQPQLFRGSHESGKISTYSEDESDLESLNEGKYLYCKLCNNKITNELEKITMGGKIEHTFFNPNGNLFHISCFKEASGCQAVGVISTEFSWFPGFAWQIVCCLRCREHLGWLFIKGEDSCFFGLILTRLKKDN
ncbi:MAG: hypothetical protein HQL69_03895 [Magnetococcales bacterium]|nr:hypothetical protein [Magnetococcales bacterium]